MGRARAAAQPTARVRLERLPPPPAQPRLLGLAARLRPCGLLRLGHCGRARALQPALPVRLVAVLRRGVAARPRARHGQGGRGRRRRGVRLRSLPRHGGRPPARHLRRRHPARAVPAAARLPAWLPRTARGGLGRGRVAGQPRLHARAAVRLPAGPAGAARRDLVVARGPSRLAASPARRELHRDRVVRRGLRLPGTPVPEGGSRVPDGETHAQGSQELLLGSMGPAGGLLGEPRLGRDHRGRERTRSLEERGRVLPGWGDRAARADRAGLVDLHAPLAHRPRVRGDCLLDPRARHGAHRRRLPLPPAVRPRPRLERGARTRAHIHARNAVPRAARGRRRVATRRDRARVGRWTRPARAQPDGGGRRRAARCGAGRRRGRAPRPSDRAAAGEGRDRVAWADHGPAHRRRG